MPQEKVKALRDQIDKIDSQLVDLLQQRVTLAQQIWQLKQQAHSDFNSAVREQEILTRVTSLASPPTLSAEDIATLFTKIITITRTNAQR